jgi:cytochrome P450 PksS
MQTPYTASTEYPVFDIETRANPQAMYNNMRETDPVYPATGPITGNRIWFLTRYADVSDVLKDQRFIKDVRNNLAPEYARQFVPEDEDPTWQAINRHLLNLDAPDHTRLRHLVHKAFTPGRVRDLKPRIEAITTDLLDKMQEQSDADLIDAFAFPLPITVIAEMLGVDQERRDDFRRWTNALLFGRDEAAGRVAVMEFIQYVNSLIDARRDTDTGDILSALVRVEEEGDTLDRMELLSMVFLLLVAGHETTVNLIGNGTLALLQHPGQFALLRENLDELLPSAVEEMLRYNGPVETPTTRWASEDISIGGVTIPEGDLVLPSLLGANRDPAVFAHPNTFDITRDPNPHIAFGAGVHFCLGAPLARLEATIAFKHLVQRLPALRLNTAVDKLQWNSSLLIHGMKSLPVAW